MDSTVENVIRTDEKLKGQYRNKRNHYRDTAGTTTEMNIAIKPEQKKLSMFEQLNTGRPVPTGYQPDFIDGLERHQYRQPYGIRFNHLL